jgi:hypothetical protein
MSKLWVSLKRDKVYADIYYRGEKILTIKVDEQNRGNVAIVSLDAGQDVRFKIVKDNNTSPLLIDESKFNSEEFNK